MTSHSDSGSVFRSKKYTGFPSISDDVMAGNLKATFILAPLAMVINRKGIPLKIVHLGHRDGTTMMVRSDSPYHTFADLKGKRIAIPHRYSNQRILVERLREQAGLAPKDITLIDYPPPEMPSGLKTGQFEAFLCGEPFPAKTEIEGYGRVLYYTKDAWPEFISCVLAVHEDLIKHNRPLVQELVTGISKSGLWIDQPDGETAPGVELLPAHAKPQRKDPGKIYLDASFGHVPRMQAAAIAARKEYYNQDPELMKFVLSKPPDRVKYTNLIPARKDMEEIQRYAERLGYFDFRPVTKEDPFGFEDYTDASFATGK